MTVSKSTKKGSALVFFILGLHSIANAIYVTKRCRRSRFSYEDLTLARLQLSRLTQYISHYY